MVRRTGWQSVMRRWCLPPAAMAAVDAAAIDAGLPGTALMETAGRAVTAAILGRWGETGRARILVGKGNNGGDGLVVARTLVGAGWEVELALFCDPAELIGDAGAQWALIEPMGLVVERIGSDSQAAALGRSDEFTCSVDALLGTGLRGDVREPMRTASSALHEGPVPVIAVDAPSGLDGSTGRPHGIAVRALVTVTFGFPKPGLFLGVGPVHTGHLIVAPLGYPPGALEAAGTRPLEWSGLETACAALPPLDLDAHKGSAVKLLLVAGSEEYLGAAVLAATAALRSGVGLCTIATPASIAEFIVGTVPEVIVESLAVTDSGELSSSSAERVARLAEGVDAIAIGPGLGGSSGVRPVVEAAIAAGAPLLVDADGLNALADAPGTIQRDPPTVRRADRFAGSPVGARRPGTAGRSRGAAAARVGRRLGGPRFGRTRPRPERPLSLLAADDPRADGRRRSSAARAHRSSLCGAVDDRRRGGVTRTQIAALSTILIVCGFLGPRPAIAQRFNRFDPEDWITLRDFRFVTSVAVSNEIAYFGTTAGVERFDTLRDRWLAPITTADGLPHERVTAVVVDPTGGELWIGTARGVSRYTEFIGEVERVFGPPPTFVEELKLDPEAGTVFAWVAGGWWRARVASPSMERSPPPPRDARGSIDVELLDPFDLPWTDPLYVESQTDHFQSVRLTELYQDLRGDFYVGTWGDNGRRWGGVRFDWEPLLFGLGGRGGGPIVESTDGMWFVPTGPSIARVAAPPPAIAFVDRDGSWSHVVPRSEPGLPTALATSAAAAGDTLYLGSEYGLTRYAEGEWKTHGWTADPPIEAVTALHVDGPRLWVGTSRGLTLWDRKTDRPSAHFLNGRSISALAVSDDAVFVGTNLGLYVGQRDPSGGAGFA
ncbi:MAG: NAD(P)H-hydrate epimerase, partial [Gemmatimonadota bacterium]